MIPPWNQSPLPYGLSRAEFQAVIKACIKTLEDATATATLDGPLPLMWRSGWSYRWKYLGRDRAGHVMVRITVQGPPLARPYTRRKRLVSRKHLPGSLELGLREG